MLTTGAVELAELMSEKSSMQDVADEAALNGAAQMDLSLSAGVLDRTAAAAKEALVKMGRRSDMQVQTAYLNAGSAIQVTIHAHRMSFFANMFPPGGFDITVNSVAASEGRVPLCVLAHGDGKKNTIELKSQSQISAPGCFVQSNDDIVVAGGGRLSAFETRAVTSAVGPISPAAKTDAASIPDPFLNLNLAFPSTCPKKLLPEIYTAINATIPAGLHCADIQVLGGARVTLAPGEHYFAGDLTVNDISELVGDDVVLGFDDKSKFDFTGNAKVSLTGRKSGPLAGFVIYSVRNSKKKFTISSDHVNVLLGTIYIPSTELDVVGTSPVAQSSAWTVIVASGVKLDGNPTLVMNANYAASDVPVPKGVGPTRHNTRLVN